MTTPSQEPFQISPALGERLDRIGHEFLADFFQRECERHPGNLLALAEMAHALTRLGRLEAGLEADLRLSRLAPDNPTVHYNLACSLALLGRLDGALEALERAVECGYDDPEHLVRDEDLRALQPELRFQRLVRKLEAEAADLSSP